MTARTPPTRAGVYQHGGLPATYPTQRARQLRLVQFAIVCAMVAPSPALASGVASLLSPAALAVAGAAAWLQSRSVAKRSGDLQQLLTPYVMGGLALCASSLFDGGATSGQRAIARLVTVFAVVTISRFLVVFPHVRPAMRRAIVYGAAVSAAIAIVSSVGRLTPLGSELLPNRDFILPLGLPKTTGLPRSFGEAGLIYAGGLVFTRELKRVPVRFLSRTVIFGGFAVGQSRNMIAVLVAALLLMRLAKLVRVSWAPRLAGLAALLSPIFVSVVVTSSSVADGLVGQGVFARNVGARLSLLRQVSLFRESQSLDLLGTDYATWGIVNGASPHNHFVSLVVIDGVIGVFFIIVAYVRAMYYAGRGTEAWTPEFVWLVSCIVALSFYEGAYSASVALATGFYWAAIALRHDATPDARQARVRT